MSKQKADTGKQKKEEAFIPILVFALIVLTIGVLIYVAVLPHRDRSFNDEYAYRLLDGWTYTDGDGKTEAVELNQHLPENIRDGVRIENILPDTDEIPYNTIALYAHYQRLRIFLDDQLYAESADPYAEPAGLLGNDGNFWYTVRLPEDPDGRKIAIEVTSPYENHRYVEQTVYIGYKWPIMMTIISEGMPYLAGAMILILFSILCLVSYLITLRKGKNLTSTAYLSGTLFWIGIWIMDQSGIMQLFNDNARVVNYLGYAPIVMGTVFAMLYLMSIMQDNFRPLNRAILLAMVICWSVMTILQVAGIRDYYRSIRAYHVVIAIFMLAMLAESFWISFVRKNRSMWLAFFLILLLIGYTSVQLVVFYQHNGIVYNSASSLILFLLIIAVLINELVRAAHTVDLANRSAIYKHTSVTDQMTGLANKRGLYEWIDQHEQDFDRIVTAVFVMDLNRLKYLNDHLGHQTGDKAITTTAEIIRQVFESNGITSRTGGDEFTSIVLLEEGQTADKLQEKFLELVKLRDREFSFPFSVSVGHSYYEENENIQDTIKRADAEMYKMKRATGMERRD